eukprot:g3718.t1
MRTGTVQNLMGLSYGLPSSADGTAAYISRSSMMMNSQGQRKNYNRALTTKSSNFTDYSVGNNTSSTTSESGGAIDTQAVAAAAVAATRGMATVNDFSNETSTTTYRGRTTLLGQSPYSPPAKVSGQVSTPLGTGGGGQLKILKGHEIVSLLVRCPGIPLSSRQACVKLGVALVERGYLKPLIDPQSQQAKKKKKKKDSQSHAQSSGDDYGSRSHFRVFGHFTSARGKSTRDAMTKADGDGGTTNLHQRDPHGSHLPEKIRDIGSSVLNKFKTVLPGTTNAGHSSGLSMGSSSHSLSSYSTRSVSLNRRGNDSSKLFTDSNDKYIVVFGLLQTTSLTGGESSVEHGTNQPSGSGSNSGSSDSTSSKKLGRRGNLKRYPNYNPHRSCELHLVLKHRTYYMRARNADKDHEWASAIFDSWCSGRFGDEPSSYNGGLASNTTHSGRIEALERRQLKLRKQAKEKERLKMAGNGVLLKKGTTESDDEGEDEDIVSLDLKDVKCVINVSLESDGPIKVLRFTEGENEDTKLKLLKEQEKEAEKARLKEKRLLNSAAAAGAVATTKGETTANDEAMDQDNKVDKTAADKTNSDDDKKALVKSNSKNNKVRVKKLKTNEMPLVEDTMFRVFINHIGISLVDAYPRELLYASVTWLNVDLQNRLREDLLEVNCQIGSFQVDNQLRDATYPVLLRIKEYYNNETQNDGEEKSKSPSALVSSKRDGTVIAPAARLDQNTALKIRALKDQTHLAFPYFQNVEIALQPLDIRVDEQNALSLVKMFSNLKFGPSEMEETGIWYMDGENEWDTSGMMNENEIYEGVRVEEEEEERNEEGNGDFDSDDDDLFLGFDSVENFEANSNSEQQRSMLLNQKHPSSRLLAAHRMVSARDSFVPNHKNEITKTSASNRSTTITKKGNKDTDRKGMLNHDSDQKSNARKAIFEEEKAILEREGEEEQDRGRDWEEEEGIGVRGNALRLSGRIDLEKMREKIENEAKIYVEKIKIHRFDITMSYSSRIRSRGGFGNRDTVSSNASSVGRLSSDAREGSDTMSSSSSSFSSSSSSISSNVRSASADGQSLSGDDRDSSANGGKPRLVSERSEDVDEENVSQDHLSDGSTPGNENGEPQRERLFAILGIDLIPHFSNAHVVLGECVAEYEFRSIDGFTSLLIRHYGFQALKQILKVVGSLDILGNPAKYIGSIGKFVANPTPEALRNGTLNFFAGTTSAAFNVLHSVSGTANRALVKATFPTRRERRVYRQRMGRWRHKNAFHKGVRLAGYGVVDGITGVVNRPIEGARAEGMKGLFKGVARGMLGLFLKPAAGVFEAAAITSKGVAQNAKALTVKKESWDMIVEAELTRGRVRVPRRMNDQTSAFAPMLPFNIEDSEAEEVLYRTKRGRYKSYLSYVYLEGVSQWNQKSLMYNDERFGTYIFVTPKKIVLVDVSQYGLTRPIALWEVRLKEVVQIHLEQITIDATTSTEERSNSSADPTSKNVNAPKTLDTQGMQNISETTKEPQELYMIRFVLRDRRNTENENKLTNLTSTTTVSGTNNIDQSSRKEKQHSLFGNKWKSSAQVDIAEASHSAERNARNLKDYDDDANTAKKRRTRRKGLKHFRPHFQTTWFRRKMQAGAKTLRHQISYAVSSRNHNGGGNNENDDTSLAIRPMRSDTEASVREKNKYGGENEKVDSDDDFSTGQLYTSSRLAGFMGHLPMTAIPEAISGHFPSFMKEEGVGLPVNARQLLAHIEAKDEERNELHHVNNVLDFNEVDMDISHRRPLSSSGGNTHVAGVISNTSSVLSQIALSSRRPDSPKRMSPYLTTSASFESLASSHCSSPHPPTGSPPTGSPPTGSSRTASPQTSINLEQGIRRSDTNLTVKKSHSSTLATKRALHRASSGSMARKRKGSVLTDAKIQGYLYKEGGLVKSWKRRWFAVYNGVLYYSFGPEEKEAIGCLPLVQREVNPDTGHLGGLVDAVRIQKVLDVHHRHIPSLTTASQNHRRRVFLEIRSSRPGRNTTLLSAKISGYKHPNNHHQGKNSRSASPTRKSRADSRLQRADSRLQRADSRLQRADSRLQRGNSIASVNSAGSSVSVTTSTSSSAAIYKLQRHRTLSMDTYANGGEWNKPRDTGVERSVENLSPSAL